MAPCSYTSNLSPASPLTPRRPAKTNSLSPAERWPFLLLDFCVPVPTLHFQGRLSAWWSLHTLALRASCNHLFLTLLKPAMRECLHKGKWQMLAIIPPPPQPGVNYLTSTSAHRASARNCGRSRSSEAEKSKWAFLKRKKA